MKLRSITARAAVAGATTALIAGGLVAATGTAADAADASGDYTCAVPVLGDLTFPLSVSVPVPPTAPAGYQAPAGLLTYTSAVTVPASAASLLGDFGVNGGTIDDFTMNLGSTVVPAPGTYTAGAPGEDGSVVMAGNGANDAFSLPKAGSYAVTLPSSFTFSPTLSGVPLDLGGGPVTVACTTDAPATIGSVTLTKQVSTTTGAVKRIRTGYKVTATVTNDGYTVPTGKVVAKVGTKSFKQTLNSKGKALFKFRKSFKGKKAVLVYKGDGYTQGSKSKTFRIR